MPIEGEEYAFAITGEYNLEADDLTKQVEKIKAQIWKSFEAFEIIHPDALKNLYKANERLQDMRRNFMSAIGTGTKLAEVMEDLVIDPDSVKKIRKEIRDTANEISTKLAGGVEKVDSIFRHMTPEIKRQYELYQKATAEMANRKIQIDRCVKGSHAHVRLTKRLKTLLFNQLVAGIKLKRLIDEQTKSLEKQAEVAGRKKAGDLAAAGRAPGMPGVGRIVDVSSLKMLGMLIKRLRVVTFTLATVRKISRTVWGAMAKVIRGVVKAVRFLLRNIAKLGKKLRTLQKTAARVAMRFRSMGRSITLAGRDMMFQSLAIVGWLYKVSDSFGEVEKAAFAFAASQRAMGKDFQTSWAAAKDQMLMAASTAASLGFGMGELNQIATVTARMGYDIADSQKIMTHAMNLARGTMSDASTSANAMMVIMQQYNMGIEESGKAADYLTFMQTQMRSSLADVSQGMGHVAPIAHQYGIALEDLSAAMIILNRSGMAATVSGRGMASMLGTLQQKSFELGIQVENQNGEMLQLGEILAQLKGQQSVFGSEMEWNTYLLENFSREEAKVVTALLNSVDASGQFTGELAELAKYMRDSEGLALELSDAYGETLPGKMAVLRASFDLLMAKVGELVVGPMTDLMQALVDLATNEALIRFLRILTKGIAEGVGEAVKFLNKHISKLNEYFNELEKVIGPLEEVLAPFMKQFGMLLGVFIALGPLLMIVGVAMQALGAILAIVVSPVGLIAAALILIALNFDKLQVSLGDVMAIFQSFGDLLNLIMEQFDAAMDTFEDQGGWIALGEAFTTLATNIKAIVDLIVELSEKFEFGQKLGFIFADAIKIFNAVMVLAQPIIEGLLSILIPLAAILMDIIGIVTGLTVAILENQQVMKILKATAEVLGIVLKVIGDMFASAARSTKKLSDMIHGKSLTKDFSALIKIIGLIMNPLKRLELIIAAIAAAFKLAGEAMGAFGDIAGTVGDIAGDVGGGIEDLGKDAMKAVTSLFDPPCLHEALEGVADSLDRVTPKIGGLSGKLGGLEGASAGAAAGVAPAGGKSLTIVIEVNVNGGVATVSEAHAVGETLSEEVVRAIIQSTGDYI